ncbi:hypothetical protein C8Q72DRAFT_530838 [Fomitopsis betulina]|nr:hypothetical protein C8Q72DRAFT_530838 [Fomitopsis betulina]
MSKEAQDVMEQISVYCAVSSTAIALYDYLLCLSTEIKCMSLRGTPTLSTLLYLGCRLAVLFSCVLVLLPQGVRSVPYCHGAQYHQMCNQYPACYHACRNRRITLASLFLGAVPVWLNLVWCQLCMPKICSRPTAQWTGDMGPAKHIFLIVLLLVMVLVCRGCSIAFDILVIYFVSRQFRCHCQCATTCAQHGVISTSLIAVLMEESAQLFVVSLAANVLHILLWGIYAYTTTANDVLLPLTAVLITRCILRLREAGSASSWISESAQTSISLEFMNPVSSEGNAPQDTETVIYE